MLSVIIPTRNSEESLARSLSALVPAAAEGMVREVVVADAGSTDGTETVAEAAGCHFVPCEPGWGRQLATGIASSHRGPWLLLLPSGVLVEGDWFREVASFVERIERAGRADSDAAMFSLELDSFGWRPRLIEKAVGLGCGLFGYPVPEQGLLMSRRLWSKVAAAGKPQVHGDVVARIGRGRIHRLRGHAVALTPYQPDSRLVSGVALAGHFLGAVGLGPLVRRS